MKYRLQRKDLDYGPKYYSNLFEFIGDQLEYGIKWDEEEETKHLIIPQMKNQIENDYNNSYTLYESKRKITPSEIINFIEDNKEKIINDFEY